MIHAALMLAAAAMSSGQRIAELTDEPSTSEPRGPGSLMLHAYTYHPPLPRPASQAKRRRKARRSPR